jgi:hypothetical protein
VFAPFQTPVTTADTVASQRIADSVQAQITGDGVTLDTAERDDFFDNTDGDDIREGYGLSPLTNVNVTLGARSVGDPYGGEPVVISRRIVVDGGGDAAEIEVRVW